MLLDAVRMRHDKLVRDRIPEIVARAGKRPVYRVLDEGEFRRAALNKLIEEAREAAEASDEERLSEFADLAEVLDAAVAAHGFTVDELRRRRELRNDERGGFAQRIYLETVEETLEETVEAMAEERVDEPDEPVEKSDEGSVED